MVCGLATRRSATAIADSDRRYVFLIVRRVRRLAPPAQGELLPAWRHHAIFTDKAIPAIALAILGPAGR